MTKVGQPSTVTTVRLVGGFCGGRVGSSLMPASSWGKCSRELVIEQGTSSSFFMYFTWGAKSSRKELLFNTECFCQMSMPFHLALNFHLRATSKNLHKSKLNVQRETPIYSILWLDLESTLPSTPSHLRYWWNTPSKVQVGDTHCLKELTSVIKSIVKCHYNSICSFSALC